MDEVWRHCVEFDNYSVSSEGRVRNDAYQRILSQSVTGSGVVKVGLYYEGRQHTRSVKVLVADAFVSGKTEVYDTPIQLDGDNHNCYADNLMWRPRWFSTRYSKQFKEKAFYKDQGPIVDRKTGVVYKDIVEAAIINGLFFHEVLASLINKVPSWPTYQMFDWHK